MTDTRSTLSDQLRQAVEAYMQRERTKLVGHLERAGVNDAVCVSLSIEDVAKRAGVGRSMMYEFMAGRGNLGWANADKVARLVGVEILPVPKTDQD